MCEFNWVLNWHKFRDGPPPIQLMLKDIEDVHIGLKCLSCRPVFKNPKTPKPQNPMCQL